MSWTESGLTNRTDFIIKWRGQDMVGVNSISFLLVRCDGSEIYYARSGLRGWPIGKEQCLGIPVQGDRDQPEI